MKGDIAYPEYLFHLICKRCNKPWSLSDGSVQLGTQLYCPHCGHQNRVEEIISSVSQPEGVKVEPPELTQPSTSADESYPLKNKIRMGLVGNILDVQIVATSPEIAKKFYEVVEAATLAMVKVDLEREWKRNE